MESLNIYLLHIMYVCICSGIVTLPARSTLPACPEAHGAGASRWLSQHILKVGHIYCILYCIILVCILIYMYYSIYKGVNVHVYEQSNSGFGSGVTGGSVYKRISAFDSSIDPEMKPTVRVLYRGGVHYDALVVSDTALRK